MTDCNRLKCQDIPFLIDGVAKIVKSVNKQTTCNDVINKLPNLQCLLAVFESVNGVEKELPGKTKLLKAWRAHGPSDRVVFVVKKSNYVVLKGSRSGIMKDNMVHMSTARRKARESLKKVTDLAFYVRYQKTKLQNVKRKFDEVDMSGEDCTKKVMNYSTSSRAQQIPISEYETREDVKQVYNNSIQTGITTLKLGFKQKFSHNSNAAKRTISTGTISSSDSGYKSLTSESQGHHVLAAELAKRHTFFESNMGDAPRHSTPMIVRSHGNVEIDTEENDPFDLSFYDEIEGKDDILKKFMADQERMAKEIDNRASIGCYGVLPEIEDHVKSSRFSLPTFRSQKEKCRYLWDANCDSDSDTSSVADDSVVWNASQLDNAFVDSFEDTCIPHSDCVTPRNRTMRRESAMSNLNKFSLQLMPIDIEDDNESFNYSFDCTFPRMNESQSVDYSECFGEGFSNGNDNIGINLFGGDSEDIVTRDLRKDMCDDCVVESDEGLGSMQSGIVQDIIEFYV